MCDSRHVINVTLNEDTAYHPAGAVVNALVYSGSISNPNFHFIPDGTELRSIQTVRNSVLVRATDTAAAETGTGAGTEFIGILGYKVEFYFFYI